MSDETITTQATEGVATETPAAPQAPMTRAERMAAIRAKAEKDDTGETTDTTSQAAAETEASGAQDAAPPATAKTEDTDSTAASDAAKTEKDADPKDKLTSARFAALTREKGELLKERTAIGEAKRMHAEAIAAHKADVEKMNAAHAARESKIAEREAKAEEALRMAEEVAGLKSPAAFFKLLEDRLGIKSEDDLRRWARGVWEKPKPAEVAKPVDEKERPLTRAEWEKLQEERDAKREEETKARAAREETLNVYDKGFDEKDEGGNHKFAAARLIFSKDDRIREGDRIANALRASGRQYASHAEFLADVREAVNTLAEQDSRWEEWKTLRAHQASSANSTKPADKPSATKAAESPARQSTPGQPAPSKDEKKPAAANANLNGATPPASYRDARRQ